MKKDVQISFRGDAILTEEFKKILGEQDLTPSYVFRKCMKEYVNKYNKEVLKSQKEK